MTRHFFGDEPGDFVVSVVGQSPVVLANAAGTVWTAKTGGAQLTDLKASDGTTGITSITSRADGRVGFYGPDGVTSCWVDFGQGRYFLTSSDYFTGGGPGGSVDDATLVHLGGAETITGPKTFSAAPTVPTPTATGHAATKAYVDGVAGSGGSGSGIPATGFTGTADLSGAAKVLLPAATPPTAGQRAVVEQRLHRATFGLQVHATAGQDDTVDHFDAHRATEAALGVTFDQFSYYVTVNSNAGGTYLGATQYATAVGALLAEDPYRNVLLVVENFCAHPGKDGNLYETVAALADPANQFTINLKALADAIVTTGSQDRVAICLMHEANAAGEPWQIYANPTETNPNTSALFKQAFQGIVTAMRARGVTTRFVQWFLCSNSGGDLTDYATHYAGDAYVDKVGLTYYNRAGLPSTGYGYWEGVGHQLREPLRMIERMTRNPVWICESACAKETTDTTKSYFGQSKAKWLKDVITAVRVGDFPRVEHLVLFLVDASASGGESLRDWTLQTTEQQAAVTHALLRAQHQQALRPSDPGLYWTRNLLPADVECPTSLALWTVAGTSVTMALDTDQPWELDTGVGSIKVTKPSSTASTSTSSSLRYTVPDNGIYVPGSPYVLTFWAKGSVDGLLLSAGIRQASTPNTFVGDESIRLGTAWEQHTVQVISSTTPSGSWRLPFFGIGQNAAAGSVWLTGIRFGRGVRPAPPVDRLLRKRVAALTYAATLTPICETTDVATCTLTGNVTLAAPAGTPGPGQVLEVWLTQDGTGSRVLTLASGSGAYSDPNTLGTLTTAAGKTDLLTFEWVPALTRWCLVRAAKGF